MKQKRRLGFGWRLWLSSLMVLILPLLGLFFAYQTSSQVIEEQTYQANLNLLTHTRDVLDSSLTEMDSLSARLLMDARINRLSRMTRRLTRGEIYRLREAWLGLSQYTLVSNYLTDLFIILQGSNTVLTPSAPYIDIENFYRHFFQYEDLDYAQWSQMLFGTHHKREWLPVAQVRLGDRALRVLTYLQSMPSDAASGSGVIVSMIDEAQIHAMLERIEIKDGGWVCVLDDTGTLMTHIGSMPEMIALPQGENAGYFEETLSDEAMLISFTRSAVNQWVYLSAVPRRVLMQQLDWLQRLMRQAAMVALLAGLVLAAFIANRNSRPVRKQAPLLRQSFFDRLFAGEFHSDKEIDAYLEHIRLSLGGDRYAVMLVRLRGDDGAMTSEKLDSLAHKQEALMRAVPRQGFVCHPLGMGDVAVLFILSRDEEFQQSAQRLVDRFRAQGLEDSILRIGTGMPCDSLFGIHTSYLQARQAMRYFAAADVWSIARYEALPTTDAMYDFSLRMETHLIHLVMAGSREETEKLLMEAYRQNIEERHISLDMARHYTNELFNTAMKIIGQLPASDGTLREAAMAIDERMRDDAPLDEIHSLMMQMYDRLCQTAQAAKRSRSEEHAQDLLAFVETHAYQESLSLSVVAKAFGRTDAYVSQYFKEHAGENFSDYLERIRLQRARELLANDTMPVYRIAAEIGYGNDNTFRRAFKRRFGISPSEYRESPPREQI